MGRLRKQRSNVKVQSVLICLSFNSVRRCACIRRQNRMCVIMAHGSAVFFRMNLVGEALDNSKVSAFIGRTNEPNAVNDETRANTRRAGAYRKTTASSRAKTARRSHRKPHFLSSLCVSLVFLPVFQVKHILCVAFFLTANEPHSSWPFVL